MWRETDIGGVLVTPLAAYMLAALLLHLLLRAVLVRVHAYRWTANPPLADAAIYLCILGALVGLL